MPVTLPETVEVLEEPIYGPYRMAHDLLRSGMTVLDVGCGNGKISAYLQSSGAVVDGIEPSESRAEVARKRIRHVSEKPAGGDDPVLQESYDMVCFFDVLEHIADSEAILEWAASKLAPGGRIFAVIPNSAHYAFRRKILRGDWSMHDSGLFDRTHIRFFDTATMRDLRPSSTQLFASQFFAPRNNGIVSQQLLRVFPNMFALHGVMIWGKLPNPPSYAHQSEFGLHADG